MASIAETKYQRKKNIGLGDINRFDRLCASSKAYQNRCTPNKMKNINENDIASLHSQLKTKHNLPYLELYCP
jgi:hypothetical protein